MERIGSARVEAKRGGKGLRKEPMTFIYEDGIMKPIIFYVKLKS